ncbi:3'(2'),5'-bisphosphate nucleotidase CysQ [Roseibium hamelinense]|nr:3'(2'),5'-bisphosphate nucleotidase CysQ [Roseibium hamelinense]
MTFFGQSPETWFKDNKSPVSEADLAVDRFLEAELLKQRPGYGWLSEETVDRPERLSCDRVFIVDPIDGTRAFLAGGSEWTVAIAVVSAGRPRAACVYCPVKDEIFTAQSGFGASMNGTEITVSARPTMNGAILAGPHSIAANDDVARAGVQRSEYIRSLAYRIALVADGRIDIAAARKGPCDWDLAAADLLVQEAGGLVCDLLGNTVSYNKADVRHPTLIAAPDQLIGEAIGLVSKASGA